MPLRTLPRLGRRAVLERLDGEAAAISQWLRLHGDLQEVAIWKQKHRYDDDDDGGGGDEHNGGNRDTERGSQKEDGEETRGRAYSERSEDEQRLDNRRRTSGAGARTEAREAAAAVSVALKAVAEAGDATRRTTTGVEEIGRSGAAKAAAMAAAMAAASDEDALDADAELTCPELSAESIAQKHRSLANCVALQAVVTLLFDETASFSVLPPSLHAQARTLGFYLAQRGPSL